MAPPGVHESNGRIRRYWTGSLFVFLATVPFGGFYGCSTAPSRVKPPQVDPGDLAAAAIKAYDKDGDGGLGQSELAGCPALLKDLSLYDLQKDNKLTQDELLTQFREIYSRGVGLTSLVCNVTFQGQPLAGAEVRFVPEGFLGDKILPAKGTTNTSGMAVIAIPDDLLTDDLKGLSKLQLGLYRVEITHPTKTLPAKYNVNTQLGYGMHPANRGEPLVFELK